MAEDQELFVELIDVMDKAGNITGQMSYRSAVSQGFFTPEVHLLLSDEEGNFLCKQRVERRWRFGGYWNTTAAITVFLGQTFYEAAKDLYDAVYHKHGKLEFVGRKVIDVPHAREIIEFYRGPGSVNMPLHSGKDRRVSALSIPEIENMVSQDMVTPQLATGIELVTASMNLG